MNTLLVRLLFGFLLLCSLFFAYYARDRHLNQFTKMIFITYHDNNIDIMQDQDAHKLIIFQKVKFNNFSQYRKYNRILTKPSYLLLLHLLLSKQSFAIFLDQHTIMEGYLFVYYSQFLNSLKLKLLVIINQI